MKHAFTLIELLVYMAIMGFIIVVAGRVFSDSTVMRMRSQNMIRSSEEVGRISNLINEDVSQMGAKAWGESDASNYQVKVDINVYMNTDIGDFSSYILLPEHDNLIFRKIAFNQDGTYAGVREINWYLSNENIYRSCKTVSGIEDEECPSSSPNPVLMGSNVTKLEFFPSKPGLPDVSTSDILFSTNASSEFILQGQPSVGDVINLDVQNEGDVSSVRGLESNVKNQTGEKRHGVLCLAEKTGSCMEFTFYKGETYVIEFEMPFDRSKDVDSIGAQFLPGEDHLAVGLRKSDFSTIPGASSDILIYPPQSNEDLLRHIEISPKDNNSASNTISASLALTLAFYSPKAYQGRFRFKNFRIFRKSDETFHFPEGDYGTVDITEKKNAKAFKMILEVDHKGEKAGTYAKDKNGMVILTPNNGISAIGSNL